MDVFEGDRAVLDKAPLPYDLAQQWATLSAIIRQMDLVEMDAVCHCV